MTPVTRLLAALVVAGLAVGGLLWWLERPPAPAPGPPAGAPGDADPGRAQRIRELRQRLEAQRAAIAEARNRRADAGEELERLRRELTDTRTRIERLEARAGDGGGDAGD